MPFTDRLRDRITAGATGLFKHAGYPLARTLEHEGDPGLFGPESVSWRVIGDVATFVGGIRALLVQAAHPEVVAGVADHSRYREDPLGRLSRTSNYVTATTFGAMPEVAEAVAVVRRMHARVRGTSHRGVRYAADVPDLAAWVHNALTDGFLTAHQVYGPEPLTPEEADRFVDEQTRIGRLLDADPVPGTAAGLRSWLEGHAAVAGSPGLAEATGFLRRPPLPWTIRLGYRVLFQAAVATIPPRLRRTLGLRRHPGAITVGRLAVRFLRWALGSSPTWNLALVRVGAPVPEGRFRQPLPIDALDTWGGG
ncbi:MAG: DUF2236 domain-containing protein [Actinobacteria bacterium]|nr:DUF2236 domain-containing protein [Actinomycetota bacterium]